MNALNAPASSHVALVATCLTAMLAALALSTAELGVTPFWIDESMTVLPARSIHEHGVPRSPFDTDFMPFQVKWDLWDMGTPLYRYAVGAFTAVTGFSEFTTRLFSLLMGAVATLALFRLVRNLRDARTAWLAATFLLCSPAFLVFAREARHFTFVMALSIATLHLLYQTSQRPDGNAGALWPAALVATLLSQTLGYMILPIAALYVLACGPRLFFKRVHLPAHAAAVFAYLGVMAFFWDTLPFFHNVACDTRPAGCQPEVGFYLGVLSQFLEPITTPFAEHFWKAISLQHLLCLLGAGVLVVSTLRSPGQRRAGGLLLLWLLVPLALLSTRDVKFTRYLLIWALPPLAVLVAIGANWLLDLRWLRSAGVAPSLALVVLVVLAPQLRIEGRPGARSFEAGLAAPGFVRDQLLDPRKDNFQRIRYQALMVDYHARPNDVVVTSFDDAGLHYYTGRFVHGFLNSRHTDAYFMDLLAETRARGGRILFVDGLPTWNFCLTSELPLRSIDCREKYERFYDTCSGSPDDPSHSCIRIPIL